MPLEYLPKAHRRILRLILAGTYLVSAVSGLAVLLYREPMLPGVLGWWVQLGWTLLVVLGGVAGLFAVVSRRWTIERWAAPLCAGGLTGNAIINFTLIQGMAADAAVGRAGISVIAATLLVYRAVEADGNAYGPGGRA